MDYRSLSHYSFILIIEAEFNNDANFSFATCERQSLNSNFCDFTFFFPSLLELVTAWVVKISEWKMFGSHKYRSAAELTTCRGRAENVYLWEALSGDGKKNLINWESEWRLQWFPVTRRPEDDGNGDFEERSTWESHEQALLIIPVGHQLLISDLLPSSYLATEQNFPKLTVGSLTKRIWETFISINFDTTTFDSDSCMNRCALRV